MNDLLYQIVGEIFGSILLILISYGIGVLVVMIFKISTPNWFNKKLFVLIIGAIILSVIVYCGYTFNQ